MHPESVHQAPALRQEAEPACEDRALLELAAKAAGYKIAWEGGCVTGWMAGGGWWNPLTDDGDALRLAVKLGLTVSASSLACTASHLKVWHVISEPGAPDIYAATRRAIVRCAAELARS